MTGLVTVLAATRLLPLRESVRLSMAMLGAYRREPGSVVALARLIVDHPELEPLVFEFLDGKPSAITILEVA